MKKTATFLLLFFISHLFNLDLYAQSILLNPQSSSSSIMEINSTDKGLQVPRVYNLPASPLTGTVLYDATVNIMKYWNGSIWVPIQKNVDTGWTLNGNDIVNYNVGNVGIGTAYPTQKLEINSEANGESGLNLSRLATNATTYFAIIGSPTGLAFFNELVYVTDFNNNTVSSIDVRSNSIQFISSGLSGPSDIVADGAGNLYISNYHGNYISKYSGGGLSVFASGGFSTPNGLTFDSSGNLYVVNNGNGTISKITPAGVVTHNFATGLTAPYGCVFDPITNKIFIANYGANEVAQVDATIGGAVTTFKANIDFCTAITINSHGVLFVSQAMPNKIVKIYPNGTVRPFATTTYPFDITFDDNENLYVANQTINQVSKISKNSLSSILITNQNGDVETTNFTKNGYKLYISNTLGGTSNLAFNGIYGEGISNWGYPACGVKGNSPQGYGVCGETLGGSAIRGTATTGFAGYFEGKVHVSGALCSSNIACSSDFRLKRDFSPLSSSLVKLDKIKGYNYYWKDSTKSPTLQTGVVAQDLQKIFPELVNEETDGFLSVNYIGIIPHLIEAVKELNDKNSKLQAENDELKKKMKLYDSRLEVIEAALKTTELK